MKRCLTTLAVALLLAGSTGALAQTQLTLGTPADGSLAAGDTQLPTGENYDEYTFQGESGQSVSIRMNSEAFDTYLICLDPAGGNQQDNDDFDGTNSGLDITLNSSGLHRIGATSYSPGAEGDYTIAVYAGGEAPAPVAPATPPPTPTDVPPPVNSLEAITAVGPVTVGQPVTGQLAEGDQTLQSQELIDLYTIDVEAGQTLNISLTGDFDTYLVYQGPSGDMQENDDAQPGTDLNAGLTVTATAAGTARIGVTTYQPGMSGNYTLTVN